MLNLIRIHAGTNPFFARLCKFVFSLSRFSFIALCSAESCTELNNCLFHTFARKKYVATSHIWPLCSIQDCLHRVSLEGSENLFRHKSKLVANSTETKTMDLQREENSARMWQKKVYFKWSQRSFGVPQIKFLFLVKI